MPVARCLTSLPKSLALLCTPLLPLTAVQANPLLSEEDFFAALPTITAATRLQQQQRDLPAAVTLIDRTMIDASGAVNIADLFRLVPGFQVFHVNANKHGVVSHGHGEEHPGRLEVMVNGRSVYSAVVSTVDWQALGITVADIDYIEVVRGPNVVTHGSNAFTGAINIVTRQPLQQQGTRLTLTGGDLVTRIYNLQSGGHIGAMDISLSADFSKNDGFGDGYESDTDSIMPMNDGGEISQLALRGTYTPNLTDTLDLQLGVSSGQFGMGNAGHPAEIATRDVDANYQNLTWTRALGKDSQLKVQGFHNFTRYDQHRRVLLSTLVSDAVFDLFGIPDIQPEGEPVPDLPGLEPIAGEPDQEISFDEQEGSTHRYDLELEYSTRIDSELRVLAGAGWRLDRIQSVPQLNTGSYITDPFYRAFGNVEWKPSLDWTLNGGAMWEYNTLVGGRLSPRLGANHHLSRSQTLRASVAQAYRNPSLLDSYQWSQVVVPSNGVALDIDSVTLGHLNPERIRSAELGFLQQLPNWQSTVDLRLFYEDIDDVIDGYRHESDEMAALGLQELDPNQEFWENRNTPSWYNRGLELQWQWRPQDGRLLHFSYGYLESQGAIDRGKGDGIPPELPEQASDRVPHHSLSLLASQRLDEGLHLSGAFYYMSEVDAFKGDPVHTRRLDLRLAKRFPLAGYQGGISLLAQNLLDDDYLEFERNNRFGRRLLLTLSLGSI